MILINNVQMLLFQDLTFQIKKSKVDIFCLQEIFLSDVQRQIAAAVIDEYPYVFSAQDLSIPTPSPKIMACTVADLQTFELCIAHNCSGYPGPFVTCIIFR